MRLTLCYATPAGDFYNTGFQLDTEAEWMAGYLENLVAPNPDVIFFFVTESTDIWETEAKEDQPARSPYVRVVFDKDNHNWTPDEPINEMFLRSVMNYLQTVFVSRGHLFLNDVYDALRMPRTTEGVVVGWFMGAGQKNYVDYVITKDEECNKFYLDLTVDGEIWQRL